MGATEPVGSRRHADNMKAAVTILVACLAQGISAQWALHRQVDYGSRMGGSMGAALGGMNAMGAMGMGSTGVLNRMGGMSPNSLSMGGAFPNAGLRAVGTGPLGPLTAGSTWDCYRRTGMLSVCGGFGNAAAAYKEDDYDDTEEESPIGPGAGLLTLAGQIGADDEAAGERAMAEIRKLFGTTQTINHNFEGTVIGDMEGLEKLSAAGEAMIASAIAGMPDEELSSNAKGLQLNDLLDTVRGSQIAVTEQSKILAERLTKLTNGPMAAKGCAKELVASANQMAESFIQVPDRAQALVDEATVFHTDCLNQAMYQLQLVCKSQKMVPVAVKAAQLARDVNANTGKAQEIMKELRGKLKHCRENGVN